MIISRTPMRLPLGGGGTDLPFYCEKFGSSLVTAAVNKYMFITVSPRMDNKIKLNYSRTELVDSADHVEHPLIREALRLVGINDSVEIHSVADVAGGTGLGSSQSFLVGLLNALYYYKGETVSRYKLAEDASAITMGTLKEACGKQDQYAAAFGNINHLKITKNQRVTVSPVNISHDDIKRLERNMLLFFTGISRSANEILAEQKKKAEKDAGSDNPDSIIDHYHEIQNIGNESLKCLENGELKRFGEWMNIHWQCKRKLTSRMTNSAIDSWYQLAMDNGAIGGKLIGAGGGGFLLMYAEDNHDRISTALGKEGLVRTPFRFDFEGSRIVYDGRAF
jgi:D-glycero-alpha-D-manno-heptose-7-phosphate kinase